MKRLAVLAVGLMVLFGLWTAPAVALSSQENLGKSIFFDQNVRAIGTNPALRVMRRSPAGAVLLRPSTPAAPCTLLTDFTYDNLGVARNPMNPFYGEADFNPLGAAWIDLGLGGFLASRTDYQHLAAANNGKMKVPTLRNADKWDSNVLGPRVKAYTHNGYFKTLKQIVHFYNTRDAKPACLSACTTVEDAIAQNSWPAPEVPVNVNTTELGNLHLTDAQEDAIVAFMKTLSDGFVP